MAKKSPRSQADDTGISDQAQPRSGRTSARGRRTGQQPAGTTAEPQAVVSQEAASGAPETFAAHAVAEQLATGDTAAELQARPALPEPSEEEIRLRAYHRYLERGRVHGRDLDDWVAAERELKRQ